MHNTAETMSRLHKIQEFGTKFRARIDDILDKTEGYDETSVNLIGIAEDKISEALEKLRPQFETIERGIRNFLVVGEPTESKLPTDREGPVLHALAAAAKDPAVHTGTGLTRQDPLPGYI